jgi:hypothetical protein
MEKQKLAAAFNLWLSNYLANPEAFERQRQTIQRTQQECAAGEVPSYGGTCAAYLLGLMNLA